MTSAEDQSGLDPAIRIRSLAGAMSAIGVAGISLGMTLPLLGLLMEQMGVSTTVIGLNTAMPALAIVVLMPVIPRLVTRVGTTRFLLVCLAVAVGTVVAFKAVPNVWVWFPLRFVQGAAVSGLFTVSEIWINEVADDDNRGRTVGLYATIMAGGFAVGPALLPLTGIDGWTPFLAAAAIESCAVVPIVLARRVAPRIEGTPSRGVLGFVSVVPIATLAALVYGAVETGVFDLLPIYGVRVGLSPPTAALMLTAVAAGNVLLQVPIGWLADRVDRRGILLGCAMTGVLGAVVLPLAVPHPWLLWPSLFVWGGVVVGLYTVGLTLLGERFRGADLAAANSAFVLLYGVGSVVGPPLVGVAMDVIDPHGISLGLGFFCATYAVVVSVHMLRSRWGRG